MGKLKFFVFCLVASLIAYCDIKMSSETLIRIAPMPNPPMIDGKIGYEEWRYASTSCGGISVESGLMTRRENNFIFGYDAKNIYFAVTSEIPVMPQTLNEDDQVELRIAPPGCKEPIVLRFDSEGKGILPPGSKVANQFLPAALTLEKRVCWQAEASVPISSLGIESIQDCSKWGLQMIRNWSSQKETGYWHKPKTDNEMGTFMPDSKAPVVSFDGFGTLDYPTTANYIWTYRVENVGTQPRKYRSKSYCVGVEGTPTLELETPNLFDIKKKLLLGTLEYPAQFIIEVKPGESGLFQTYKGAQFPGTPRLLYSLITGEDHTEYYKRTLFWDVKIAFGKAHYVESQGLPYLNAGFYPSYGRLLRVAASFNKKLPCRKVVILVKDAQEKILHTFSRESAPSAHLEDFEDETKLSKSLKEGDYSVTMESTALDGRTFTHRRTFSIRSFPWQNNKLGEDRIIIPPFKPLRLNKKTKEISALMTGYRLGDGLWSAIMADGENILAAPAQFYLDGQPLKEKGTKLISAEKDRIVYRTMLFNGQVDIALNQEYDYDGFCKLTVQVKPKAKMKLNSFELRFPLKNEMIKYSRTIVDKRRRALGMSDCSMPAGEGEIVPPHLWLQKGRTQGYLWLGGIYRGLCLVTDSPRNYSLDKAAYAQKMERKGDVFTLTQYIVNRPTEWEKPFDIVLGIEPTPVKPINEKYRRLSQHMYDYPPAKNSDVGGYLQITQWPMGYQYPINAFPNGDRTEWELPLSTRGKAPLSREELKKKADEYYARHRNWATANAPLWPLHQAARRVRDFRRLCNNYYLMYHNPTFYSDRWPEAEMYKAEWLPYDYPVDDARNEYVACLTHEYIDKMLYEMHEHIRAGFDGMNFDCFVTRASGGHNTVSVGAVRDRPGKVPFLTNDNMMYIAPDGIIPSTNILGWRELTKRTAHMMYKEGRLTYGVPWVEVHATFAQVAPMLAFCSTVITTECGSLGGDFHDRFPEGYVLADLAGTQCGVVPRNIVHVRGANPNVAIKDELTSLISWSFAYGTMNHVDQGVARGYAEYQKARDEVYEFGFGKPDCKTLVFYGKEKQPVTCDAENIRTTQLIRPDGQAMVMIGNLGEAVKATFDLKGLGYGKCVITDVFAGKVIPAAELQIPRHGYALLKIQRIP